MIIKALQIAQIIQLSVYILLYIHFMKYIHSGGWFLMMSAKKNEVAKTAVQLEAFSRLPVKLCSIKKNIYSLKKT